MSFEPEPASPDPIVYATALGTNVIDVDGNRYVDMAAGFGAILLGHCAQRSSRALEMQAHRGWAALGDVFPSDAKIAMVERVAALHPTPGARVILCQSGSDAITAALKTSVLHTGRPGVLAFEGAYHGMGYAPLAACGYRESFREPFGPQLNPNVTFCPFPSEEAQLEDCLRAVREALAWAPIGTILVEPILGRGGCIVPPPEFLPQLASIAHEAGVLIVADEIWTGLGRCGEMLACSRVGLVPDILCLGKGLGGGLPISACVAPEEIMRAWKLHPGVVHTSTLQGNSLACSTGVDTLDALRSGKLAERAEEVGTRFMLELRSALRHRTLFRKITGAGLMVGLALESGAVAAAVRQDLLARGYIVVVGGTDASVLTLTPPLTIAEELLEGFVRTVADVLEQRAHA